MGWEKKESTILPFKVQSCKFLNRKPWKEKEMRKVQKSRNPRSTIQSSFCASTVLGQLGKTIDRISSRTMKRLIFLRMLGVEHVFVVLPAPSSTSTHPKFILGAVWKQTLKGKWHLKSRNPRSGHPKLKLQVFEKKQQKENGMRKEGIRDLTIQSSVLQVFE